MWAQAIQRARDLYATLNSPALPRLAQRALSLDSGSAFGGSTMVASTGGRAWPKSSGTPRRAVGERASSPCLEAVISEEEDEEEEEASAGGGACGGGGGREAGNNGGLPEGTPVKERAHSDRALDRQGPAAATATGLPQDAPRKPRVKSGRCPETLDLSASENLADRLRFKEKLGPGSGGAVGQGDKTPTLPRSSSGSVHGDGEDDVHVNYEGLLGDTAYENNAVFSSSGDPNGPPPSLPTPESKPVLSSSPPPPPSQAMPPAAERRGSGSQRTTSNKVEFTTGTGTGSTDRRGSQSSSSASNSGSGGGGGGAGGGEKEGGESSDARAVRKLSDLKRELGARRETETLLREVLHQRDRRLLANDRQVAELEHALLETQQEVARLRERLAHAGGQRRDATR